MEKTATIVVVLLSQVCAGLPGCSIRLDDSPPFGRKLLPNHVYYSQTTQVCQSYPSSYLS
jgi:hypothetical protein